MIIISKIQRKLMKFRLQPIHVFCLHHVCERFDAESMCLGDWMALSKFKHTIIALQKDGYTFISLTKAYQHLQNDFIRRKKYAVLTFDDGYKSLKEVLPWLERQNIPTTLFINGKYLDGTSYRETTKEQYLTYDELFALNSPLIEIGHHGWEHTDATMMTEEELEESLQNDIEILSSHSRYIPFWAYTWGHHTNVSDCYLKQKNIIPILINGGKNYKFKDYIDRELL